MRCIAHVREEHLKRRAWCAFRLILRDKVTQATVQRARTLELSKVGSSSSRRAERLAEWAAISERRAQLREVLVLWLSAIVADRGARAWEALHTKHVALSRHMRAAVLNLAGWASTRYFLLSTFCAWSGQALQKPEKHLVAAKDGLAQWRWKLLRSTAHRAALAVELDALRCSWQAWQRAALEQRAEQRKELQTARAAARLKRLESGREAAVLQCVQRQALALVRLMFLLWRHQGASHWSQELLYQQQRAGRLQMARDQAAERLAAAVSFSQSSTLVQLVWAQWRQLRREAAQLRDLECVQMLLAQIQLSAQVERFAWDRQFEALLLHEVAVKEPGGEQPKLEEPRASNELPLGSEDLLATEPVTRYNPAKHCR